MSRLNKDNKVICIDGNFDTKITSKWFEQLPKTGETYTLREVRPQGAEGGVLLTEIINTPKYFDKLKGKIEPAFHPSRFITIDHLDKVFEEEKIKEELITV